METAFVLVIFKDFVQATFQLIHGYAPSAGFKFVDNRRILTIKASEASQTCHQGSNFLQQTEI
jgi:hypothetical protein